MSDSQHAQQPILLLLGTREVCVPLVQIARPLDFRLVVCGNQPGFADPEVFAGAACHTIDFDDLGRTAPVALDERCFVVIATREHRYDEACLRQVLLTPVSYVGVMGNSRRAASLLERLAADGYDAALLNRVQAPIGLRLRAKTQPEIALSIVAQVVEVRRSPEAAAS